MLHIRVSRNGGLSSTFSRVLSFAETPILASFNFRRHSLIATVDYWFVQTGAWTVKDMLRGTGHVAVVA